MGEVTGKGWTDYSEPRIMAADLEAIEAAIAAADAKAESARDAALAAVTRPPVGGNLFDPATVESGTLSPSGNIAQHATNVTSDWIPVEGGEPYVSGRPSGLYRVVWFTDARAAISGTDTDYQAGTAAWTAPSDAAWVRIGVSISGNAPEPDMIFNHGVTLWDPETPTEATGFWDGAGFSPVTIDDLAFTVGGKIPATYLDIDDLGDLDSDSLTAAIRAEVEASIGHIEPSFPTLTFETVYTGWDEPHWLTRDGTVLLGRRGRVLLQSLDEWETRTDVHVFDSVSTIQAIREAGDGELLVAMGRDEPTGLKAKLFRSTGYDPADPASATWAEVLEAEATQAQINNSWGLHIYQNVVIAGEYGLRGENGARRVWMSEDYGQTFELIFDQKTVDAPGRPPWTETGHVHTAAWDPYWSRVWVVVGDNPNTATYYSDDKGATWTYVEGSGGPDAVQYTGIMPLPDVVLFGSDRYPNGVYAYRRGQKSDMPVIAPLILVDDRPEITRVFQLAFKRDWSPSTPTYFAASPADGREPSVIVGTVDGKKGHILWEGAHPDTAGPMSGSAREALGPTAQGNIVAMIGDPTVTGSRLIKAPAPTWARL